MWRIYALQRLDSGWNEALSAPLLRLIFDPTEDPEIRGVAIEGYPDNNSAEALDAFIRLLSDPLPQVRFWAAYALITRWADISAALPALNDALLDDRHYDEHWWSVSREAVRAVERIYYQQAVGLKNALAYSSVWGTYLISPITEYLDRWSLSFQAEGLTNDQKAQLTTSLHIDPGWFAAQLRTKWPRIRINIREPKPNAYLLDWQLTFARRKLIGGLHRDGYGIFITGQPEQVVAFALWYRDLIGTEYPLKLYQWAEKGVEIVKGMSDETLLNAIS